MRINCCLFSLSFARSHNLCFFLSFLRVGTFFEREQAMTSELKHELAGKYRSNGNTRRVSRRTKENETESVSELCVCAGT